MSNPSPAEIHRHIESLAAPGSLGRLGELAARLCEIQGTLTPVASPGRLLLFAGPGATDAMIRNVTAGGAASSVLAKATNTDLVLVDIGLPADAMPDASNYRSRKVRHGSRTTPLTADEFRAAFVVGQKEAEQAAADGMKVVAAEELGGTAALGDSSFGHRSGGNAGSGCFPSDCRYRWVLRESHRTEAYGDRGYRLRASSLRNGFTPALGQGCSRLKDLTPQPPS